MFPFGGVGAMLVGVVVSGALCAGVLLVLRRRVGVLTATTTALLIWSVLVLGLVTLLPANGAPGIVPAEGRLDHCSFDIGGPAPEGFWIFGGGQRLLNAAIFVPSGALLVLAAAHWRARAFLLVPVGFVLLALYSAGIEYTQLALARLDRACDATDVIDNVTGAALGVVLGVLLSLAVRPWRGVSARSAG